MISIFRSTRASSEFWAPYTMLFWILFGVLLSATTLVFMYLIASTSAQNVLVPKDFEERIIFDRLLSSPTCFAAEGKETKNMPLILDTSKITTNQLSLCFSSLPSVGKAYQFMIMQPEQKYSKTITTVNWQENRPISKQLSLGKVNMLIDKKMYEGEVSIGIQTIK